MSDLIVQDLPSRVLSPMPHPEAPPVADGLEEGDDSTVTGRDLDPGPPPDAPPRPAERVPDCPRPDDEAVTAEIPDFPEVSALSKRTEFLWDEDKDPVRNFAALGEALKGEGDLYRRSAYGGGLVLGSRHPNVPPTPIESTDQLLPIILDRIVVKVEKGGKRRGGTIPSIHLRSMLRSEAFLQKFPAVDEISDRPKYLPPDFRLTVPGYNDGGFGRRILFTGRSAEIRRGLEATNRFLDIMAFETEADRANALAAALVVMLRNMWPGGKPIVLVTSTKSHGGKETIICFIALGTSMVSIGYQEADWALEGHFVAALKQDPRTGLVNVDNARLDKHRDIRSAFLERFLTDPEPLLHSTGAGRPSRRPNDVVLTMSSNYGRMSEDLMNRALPIRLAPTGDLAGRRSPIGNPKLEYLPEHREQIVAELRGMIDVWQSAGRPLDESQHHPFTACTRTVGGILKANGVDGFLGNLHVRKTVDDPIRHALGLLGAATLGQPLPENANPGGFEPTQYWAGEAVRLGLVRTLIPAADRDTESGRARAMGVVLTAHRGESFEVETEDDNLTLRLEKARRRFSPGSEPATRYRFEIVAKAPIPADDEIGR